MTRKISRNWLGWDLGIIALVFGLAACDRMLATDAYSALAIVQVQVLENGDCSIPGEPTSAHRVEGTFDIALPDRIPRSYVLPIVVVNNLPGVGASTAEEMNNITLTHFTVELSANGVAWSSACPAKYDTPSFSYLIPPGGQTGATLDALTPAHTTCLLPYAAAGPLIVTASVRAKGRHGGTSIESAPLVYPITVCAGCLQQGYNDATLIGYSYPNFPPCAAISSSNKDFLGSACFSPGQDDRIVCCGIATDSGIAVLCPAAGTGAPDSNAASP